MNSALSLLIQVGVLAGLVTTFLVPCLIADYWFGLRRPWPMLVGVGSLAMALFAAYRWLIRSQRKEREVLSSSQHEVFGEVRRLRDHWEASSALTRSVPSIEIWGESTSPSDAQTSTFVAIRERHSELVTRAVEAARTSFSSLDFILSPQDVHLDSIYLSADGVGSFDLCFSVPAHERQLPWGFTAQFVDFAVDEMSDNH